MKTHLWRWGLGVLVATIAAAGYFGFGPEPPPAERARTHELSPMGAYKDSTDTPASPAKVAEAASKALTPQAAASLHPKDAQFVRLSQSKNPVDRAKAYTMAFDCAEEKDLVTKRGIQEDPRSPQACGVAPGHWQDTALRKRLIVAQVERGEFRAYSRLLAEAPDGRFAAFADDPQGYAELLAKAREVGLARAEPTVLIAESGALMVKADALLAQGHAEQAKAVYREALTAAIASEANLARELCRVPAGGCPLASVNVDLQQVPQFVYLAPRFTPAERSAIINDGLAWAKRRTS